MLFNLSVVYGNEFKKVGFLKKAEVEKRWLGTAVDMFFYGIWWSYHKFSVILETRDLRLWNLLNN